MIEKFKRWWKKFSCSHYNKISLKKYFYDDLIDEVMSEYNDNMILFLIGDRTKNESYFRANEYSGNSSEMTYAARLNGYIEHKVKNEDIRISVLSIDICPNCNTIFDERNEFKNYVRSQINIFIKAKAYFKSHEEVELLLLENNIER